MITHFRKLSISRINLVKQCQFLVLIFGNQQIPETFYKSVNYLSKITNKKSDSNTRNYNFGAKSFSHVFWLKKKTPLSTLIKTDAAATKAGCQMYLHCSPEIMDFRWNNANLLGTNTVHNNANADCAIAASAGNVGSTTPTGVDKMWKHPPASCDSTVTREEVDGKGQVS